MPSCQQAALLASVPMSAAAANTGMAARLSVDAPRLDAAVEITSLCAIVIEVSRSEWKLLLATRL